MEYRYNSADDHVDTRWLPKNVWQDRVAARFKEAAPKVIETDNGSVWAWEGKPRGEAADGSSNDRIRKSFAVKGVETPEGSLPPTDPKLRLSHLDRGGVWGTVMFGDTRRWDIKDDELRLEVYRCFNDYLLDEFASAAPERLIVQPALPTMMPQACIDELYRVAKKGAKAVEFSVFDVAEPLYSEIWEPFWSAAEETGLTIGCHIGDKSGQPYPPNIRGSLLAHYSVVPFVAAKPVAQVVFSGALERHPNLRVCFAECRVGWVDFLISWMDRQIHEREPDPTAKLSMLPSEYIKRQIRFTFEDDLVGAKLIAKDWSYIRDSAMWGGDYPHGQGIWPDVDAVFDEIFKGMDADLRREVTSDRVARFYNIKMPVTA